MEPEHLAWEVVSTERDGQTDELLDVRGILPVVRPRRRGSHRPGAAGPGRDRGTESRDALVEGPARDGRGDVGAVRGAGERALAAEIFVYTVEDWRVVGVDLFYGDEACAGAVPGPGSRRGAGRPDREDPMSTTRA